MPLERPLRPRRTIHRGVVEASAIYVDASILGLPRAIRRIVAAWVPGATVLRKGSALLVLLPSPRWIDARRAPGLPLVRVGAPPSAPLSSAPLDADELAALHPPPGAALLVAGGVVRAVDDAMPIEPSDLLDVSAFAPLAVKPLGAPPPPPAQRALAVVARSSFGVANAPPEAALLLSALAMRKLEGRSRGAVRLPGDEPRDDAGLGLSLVMGFFTAVAALLGRFTTPGSSGASAPPRQLPARGSSAGSSAGSQRGLAALPQAPRGPSLADRAHARVMTWIARALVRARLARRIGERQSDYLDQTMDMFERGDLAEALRRAVPLARDRDPDGLVIPALTVPTPRSELTISPSHGASSSSMFANDELFSHLRATYRKAFERLEREGRVDEAAFVLAELLQDNEEAVAFLERHGRLRLAAEIAEARSLPPGLVVRQWFLAGDTARAVRHARRFGAFADALARLEKHESQPHLRLLWADMLADAGDFAAAIDVVWPLPESRKLAAVWIDAVIAQGGVAGARMLARKLELVPDAFAEVLERALALLADGVDGAPPERVAFAEALLRAPATPESRTLARPTIRALIRDGARTAEPVVLGLVRNLVDRADDASLRADVPAWPVVTRGSLRALTPARAVTIAANDTGPSPVHDFVELPGGRAVVALGEAGVRVLGRDGRVLFHLDQPAHRLVISDRGDRALALAPRGDAWRIARLDLAQRRSSAWCEAELDAFAADFDGSQWIIARRAELHVIDALAPDLTSLRALPLDGRALAVGRSPTECTALVQAEDTTRWRFELPSFTLRARKPIREASFLGPVSLSLAGASGASGALLQRLSPAVPPPARPSVQIVFASETSANGTMLEIAPEAAAPLAVEVGPGFITVVTREDQSAVVRLLDDSSLTCRALVTLAGAQRARARLFSNTLAVSDDRGRVLTLDLEHGGVLRSQRV
jgi:MoxR-vWA-beta-propeller ternary system domain bpX6